MASLIGKALARTSTGPPVPIGESGIRELPGMSPGSNIDLTLIRTYKQNGTVNANVGLLASATASQQWKLYRAAPQDGRVRYTTSDKGSDQRGEVIQHAALNALDNPASIMVDGIRWPAWTRSSLMELSGIWMETTGKSHWIVDWGANDSAPCPLGYWPVRPDRMKPVPNAERYLAGWVYTAPDGTERIPLRPIDVIYNRYPDPEDPYGGAGPIRSVLTDIEAARYAGEWNRNWFINSAEPGGVIQIDHELQEGEFDELVDRWRETHRGVARAHRIAVLEGGQTWVPNAHSLRDMDFANLRSVMRDTIREALGMHKVMTGVTDDVNRANAQTGEEVFASWKVTPRLDRWKDVFNYQMLPLFGKTGQDVEFDYIYPMPANREQDNAELTAKCAAWGVLVANGADPDDAAKVVGLPPMKMIPKPPPGGLPPGTPGAGMPAPGADAGEQAAESQGGGDAANRMRQMAAWNALAGAR